MSNKKYQWKAWLRFNYLSKPGEVSYFADVSTVNKTRKLEDIAQRIVDEGSEFKYETVLAILKSSDRITLQMLLEGHSVQNGVCHIEPQVTGRFSEINAKFNSEKNKITAKATIVQEVRETLNDQVDVEIMGEKDSYGYIAKVIDPTTEETITILIPDEDLGIEGYKIKLAPRGEAGVNVFFVNEAGVSFPALKKPTVNDPSYIIIRIPALAAGTYTLRIVTRFASSSTLVQDQRTIEYPIKLIVK